MASGVPRPAPDANAALSRIFGLDTHPRAAAFLLEAYRTMSPQQKLRRVEDLRRTTTLLAEARIRAQYPDASDRDVLLRVAALTLGRSTVMRAFGWDPEREGW